MSTSFTQQAFLTGSRVYGSPGPGSDVDLVVPMYEAAFSNLARLLAEADPDDPDRVEFTTYKDEEGVPAAMTIRYGVLNLIGAANPELWRAWLAGSVEAMVLGVRENRAVTREEAVKIISRYRAEAVKG